MASVTVNGVQAAVSPAVGSMQVTFTATVALSGDSVNNINAVVTDQAGRTGSATVANLGSRTNVRLTQITADASLGTLPASNVCGN